MSAFFASRTNWIILGTMVLMGNLLFFDWTSRAQLEKRQTALIEGIQDNSWRRCQGVISQRYADRWGWKRDDLRLVFQDVRSQFLVLTLLLENPVWEIAGRKATFKAQLRVRGTPLGMGASVERMINRETEPLFFYWEKESWTPWSWKLVRMNHSEVEIPESYTPGDLLRARNGQFSL